MSLNCEIDSLSDSMTCSQIQRDEREPAESKATKPEFGIFKKRVIVVKAR